MIRKEEVYKIGRLGKAHGVHGEVSFQFDDDVFDRVDADYLILEIDGILVPFFMEEYRFRSDELAIMKFVDIDTQEQARELIGVRVFFPRQLADDDETTSVSWAEIIGFQLIDANTGITVGTITGIDDTTENFLFEVGSMLIPAARELITDVDTQSHTITVNIPDGILTLNPSKE